TAHSSRSDGADDGAAEIERRLQLAGVERLLDAASDTTGAPLFPEVIDDVCELILGQPDQQVRGGLPFRRIHSHVERPLATEAHAPRRLIELRRTHAKISEQAIDVLDSQACQLPAELREPR